MAIEWGSLKPYEDIVEVFSNEFIDAYDRVRIEKKYIGNLSLLMRAVQFNLVEMESAVYCVLSYKAFGVPYVLGGELEAWPLSEYPHLKSLSSIEDAVRHLHLAPLCDDPRALPAREANESDGAYSAKVKTFTIDWARDLAARHISHTHPDFAQAQNRMTEAYAKLFEMERTLLTLIDTRFGNKYGFDWYDKPTGAKPKIPIEVKDEIEKNRAGESNEWIDDYDSCILRFTQLKDLRSLIVNNWSCFNDMFDNKNTFKARMSVIEPMRIRIGHMNTLSADDHQEFLFFLRLILNLTQPHTYLK